MVKIIKKVKAVTIAVILLAVICIINLSTFAAENTEDFFKTNKTEISRGETLEMILDISKVQYEKFRFELTSNLDTSKIDISGDVKPDIYKNNIMVNVDKTKITLDKISFNYQVPETAQIGDKINLTGKIFIEKEGEEESEIVYEEVLNKQINVSIIEKQPNKPDNPEKQKDNEQKDFNQNMRQGFNQNSNSLKDSNNMQKEPEGSKAVYKGSNNNYLASLEIEGESLNNEFNKEKSTYFVETSGKNDLSVNVSLEDTSAKCQITGNTNLKTGSNKILISVTAENGDVRYYRIFVTNN